MIEPSDEMHNAYADAASRALGVPVEASVAGLAAVLAIEERDRLNRIKVLLSAVDNALTTGSHMTNANLAFEYLCERLGIDREWLPPFDQQWSAGYDPEGAP